MVTLIAVTLVTLLFVGPLVWRTWRDSLEDRALSLQADIQAAVNHALGGESLVAVRVKPGAQRGMGTVEIFVPSGWETVLEEVWPVVLSRIPSGYALVFRPSPVAVPDTLRHAA